MKIICAGFPKTGTKSLAKALRLLGFKVHDFPEHIIYHLDEYAQASSGDMPDFTTMYSDVDAVVVSPACLYWKEISQSFPESKIILQERDSDESWCTSLVRSRDILRPVMSKFWIFTGLLFTPKGRKFNKIHRLTVNKLHAGDSEEAMKKSYSDHNARVKTTIPQDKLLVYNVKQGWDPLCAFLGVDIPDVPFPCINVKSDIVGDLNQFVLSKVMINEVILLFALTVFFVSVLIFSLIYI